MTKAQGLLRDAHLQKITVSYCCHPMTILVMYAAPSHICTSSILPCKVMSVFRSLQNGSCSVVIESV